MLTRFFLIKRRQELIITIYLIKAITDPQMMAMKKINRMQKKKEAKKRKMAKYQMENGGKRRKSNFKENLNDFD